MHPVAVDNALYQNKTLLESQAPEVGTGTTGGSEVGPNGAAASTPRDAATGAEFVIATLATPEAFTPVLFGTDGSESALEPGRVWIDTFTIGP